MAEAQKNAREILSRELDDDKALDADRLTLLTALNVAEAKAQKIMTLIEGKETAEGTLVAFNNSLDSIRIYLSGIAADYNRVQLQKEKISEMIQDVSKGSAVIAASGLGSSVKSNLLSRISSCLGEASALETEAASLAASQKSFLDAQLISPAVAACNAYLSDPDLKELIGDHAITAEAVYAAATVTDADTSENTEEAGNAVENNNRIVAVTYGDKDSAGNVTAYKTFLLNYNDYAVVVKYGARTYTVQSGGYVVVKH